MFQKPLNSTHYKNTTNSPLRTEQCDNLHKQDNSSVPVVAHPGVDQDNASEMTVYRCHTTTGLHPLHILHSNLDAHP